MENKGLYESGDVKVIWSNEAIDYEAGFDIVEGVLKPRKIGCYVMSYEEAVDFQKKWKPKSIIQ